MQIIAVGLLLIVFYGCDTSKKDNTIEHLAFNVVDSLLGPAYEITSAGQVFRPPKGFNSAPDSIMEFLMKRIAEDGVNRRGIDMVAFFMDTTHNAGLIVSTIDSLNLSGDTTAFFSHYREVLNSDSSRVNIKEGEYWVGQVFVKNFLATSNHFVYFQLICLSPERGGTELVYFAPQDQYPKLIEPFESSIGSIKLLEGR